MLLVSQPARLYICVIYMISSFSMGDVCLQTLLPRCLAVSLHIGLLLSMQGLLLVLAAGYS